MELVLKERAGFVLVPGLSETIDSLKAQTAILDNSTAVTSNYFVRQEGIKLGEQDSQRTVLTNLSDSQKQRSQLFIRAESSKGVFAIRCIISGKYDRRQRIPNDQQYHEAAALRKYAKIKDNTRRQIYAQAVRDENQSAWDDYEAQNYIRYVLDGHDHVVNLCGFAQWTEPGNVNRGLLLLYYEYCEAGTLLEYAKRCYNQRRKAVETFIIEHVALPLLSVVDWLQSKEFILLRPSLLHRNICPENVFLHHVDGSHWPIVKLGGFEKLTPFDDSTEHIKSVGQRGPWDAPEFPAQFKSSDIWSIGAVIYAALAYGQPPPIDTIIDMEATFENSHLDIYMMETRHILRHMLITDPSQRSSITHISEAILEVKDTIRARENPVSWDKVTKDPTHEPIRFIEGYMIWLESKVGQYFANIHTLACQNPCNLDAKDAALPGVDIFEEEACRLLMQWCSIAVAKQEFVPQSKIKNCAYLMAINIYSFLKSVGDELWYSTHAQYLAISAPRRGRFLGNEPNALAIVRIRTKEFISYIQPLVEDVFWRIAKDRPQEQLNAFPQEKLVNVKDFTNNAMEYTRLSADKHSIAQDGIPSLREIAQALQVWLIEKYHQGVLECARTEERLLDRSRIHDIRDTTRASLLDLPQSWSSGIVGNHCNVWCNRLMECFRISWKISIQRLGSRKQPLRASDLADLYRIAEEFASEMVTISTDSIRITESKQEKHRASHRKLIQFLNWLQNNWNKKWRLYPKGNGPLVTALKDNLPSAAPSFSNVVSNLTAIDGIKFRIQKQIEEVRKSWANIFRRVIRFYHSSSIKKKEDNPERYTDRAKNFTARELAARINLASSDVSSGSLDPLLRQNVIYLAAYTAIFREIRSTSTSTIKQRGDYIENTILEALWPIEYAAAVCSEQRNTFRELVSSCLIKSGQQFRRMKEAPSDDKIRTQIANFETKVSRALAILYGGLGFSEDSKQVETAAEQLAEMIEDPMMEWRDKSKGVTIATLKATAGTFAKACDRLFDREWTHFRENYAKYILDRINPSSASKPTAGSPQIENPQTDLPTSPVEEVPDSDTQPVGDIRPPMRSKNMKQNPRISRKRKGNYPEPRTKIQALSDEDTDWGYSDLGRDGSWPSTSSSSLSPPPPSPPIITRRLHSPVIIIDGHDEEDQTYIRDGNRTIITGKDPPQTKDTGTAAPTGEPSTNVHSRPPDVQQVQQSATPPTTTTKDNGLPQQEPEAPIDPLQLEFEALSAHANIDWPITTLEQTQRLLDAETKRSMAHHELSKPFAWKPARLYRATSNPAELRLTITTDSGNRVVDRKAWSRQIRPRSAADLPPSPPPPPPPSGSFPQPSERLQSQQDARNNGHSNDNNDNSSRDQNTGNLSGAHQAKTTTETKEKQPEVRISNRPARYSSLSSSQLRKRTSSFSSEQATKRTKLQDGVSAGPATWTDIGKALIEIVPGAKSIAKKATDIVKLFSSSPDEAVNQEEVQPEGVRSSSTGTNIDSSATTVLLDPDTPLARLHPRPNAYENHATISAPKHIPPKTPAAQIVEWPYHGWTSTAFPGIAPIGSGPNLANLRPMPHVPVTGDGIKPISREQIEASLKAFPDSTAIKLMQVTQTDAVPSHSVPKSGTSQQPQRGSRLRSPIQFSRPQPDFSNSKSTGPESSSPAGAMDWKRTPPGFTIYEDSPAQTAQQALSLPQQQPRNERFMKYPTVAEILRLGKSLADDEHEDERWSQSWDMSWDARNVSWRPGNEPERPQSYIHVRDMSWEPSLPQNTQGRDMSWEVTKPQNTHPHIQVSKNILQKDIDLPDYKDEGSGLTGKPGDKETTHKRKLLDPKSRLMHPGVKAIENGNSHPQGQVKENNEKQFILLRKDDPTSDQDPASKYETMKGRIGEILSRRATKQKSKLSTAESV